MCKLMEPLFNILLSTNWGSDEYGSLKISLCAFFLLPRNPLSTSPIRSELLVYKNLPTMKVIKLLT